MYKVVLTAKAKTKLKLFKVSHQIAIGEVMEDLKEDPLFGKKLGRELTGKLNYRIGVYRIIYMVNERDKVVIVLNFNHRGKVYN